MKAISVILLSVLMLLQPLSKLLLVAEYQVNKNYIAEFLCINKSKPKLHCEGKCQLSKELKAAEAHDKNHPSPVKDKVEVLFFAALQPTFFRHFPTVLKSFFPHFAAPEVSPPVFGIFHPPRFLV